MKWFTSDLHYDHKKIIEGFSKRDFPTLEEHNNHITEQINKYVNVTDELWILGDFCFSKNTAAFRKSIKCKRVYLIYGNHDRRSFGSFFNNAYDTKEIKIKGHKCFLSHYPHLFWPSSHYGSLHIYGHHHYQRERWIDNLIPDRRSMDVGMDAAWYRFREFRPFSEDEILEILTKKKGHHDVNYEREWEKHGDSIII